MQALSLYPFNHRTFIGLFFNDRYCVSSEQKEMEEKRWKFPKMTIIDELLLLKL